MLAVLWACVCLYVNIRRRQDTRTQVRGAAPQSSSVSQTPHITACGRERGSTQTGRGGGAGVCVGVSRRARVALCQPARFAWCVGVGLFFFLIFYNIS